MLASYSFVHVLAFRELLVWPPGKLLVCPPLKRALDGAFSQYMFFVVEDFCVNIWSQLVFLCFLFFLN